METAGAVGAEVLLGRGDELGRDPLPAHGGRDREPVDRPAPTVPPGDHGPDDRAVLDREDHRTRRTGEQTCDTVGVIRARRLGGRLEPEREHRVDVVGRRRPEHDHPGKSTLAR